MSDELPPGAPLTPEEPPPEDTPEAPAESETPAESEELIEPGAPGSAMPTLEARVALTEARLALLSALVAQLIPTTTDTPEQEETT